MNTSANAVAIQQESLVPATFDLHERFGLSKPGQMQIQGYASRTPFVPHENPQYRPDPAVLQDLLAWYLSGTHKGFHIFGPTQCGKTELITYFCARLNIPMYEKTVHQDMQFYELLGYNTLLDGRSKFLYGPAALAMGVMGMPGILFLDEVDRARPGLMVGLNPALKRRPVTTEKNGYEVIQPMDGFRVITAGNSNLLSQSTPGYQVKRQDLSWAERFWKVKMDYLAQDQELSLLKEIFPEEEAAILERCITLANDVRDMHMGRNKSHTAIEVTLSTDTLIEWIKASYLFRSARAKGKSPYLYALDRVLLNGATEETRIAVIERTRDILNITESA